MKKTYIIMLFLFMAIGGSSQNSFKIINKVLPGIFQFNKYDIKGFSLANETIFEFNKYINPGVRLSYFGGNNFGDLAFANLMYSSSIMFTGNIKFVSFKSHQLFANIGGGFVQIDYNLAANTYPGIHPHRDIYDVVSIGYNLLGYSFSLGYQWQVSDNWFFGAEYSQSLTKYNLKINAISASLGFILNPSK